MIFTPNNNDEGIKNYSEIKIWNKENINNKCLECNSCKTFGYYLLKIYDNIIF